MAESENIFRSGAAWVRADFHLHTRADQEFVYTGADDQYIGLYTDALAKANIRVGLLANHNKFIIDEFKALRKTARKKNLT